MGKTFVSSLILSYWRSQKEDPIYYKPLATGCLEGVMDTEFVSRRSEVRVEHTLIYEPAAAPYAIEEHMDLGEAGLHRILETFVGLKSLNRPLLVEGIGGVSVPLWENYLVSDLIADLDIPALVVGLDFLGTVNHTLLSIGHLQEKGVACLGFVLNQTEDICHATIEKNANLIAKFSGKPHLLTVEYGQKYLNKNEWDSLWSKIK